jgi:hypothetical protein
MKRIAETIMIIGEEIVNNKIEKRKSKNLLKNFLYTVI